jgi:hypothetical protein
MKDKRTVMSACRVKETNTSLYGMASTRGNEIVTKQQRRRKDCIIASTADWFIAGLNQRANQTMNQ